MIERKYWAEGHRVERLTRNFLRVKVRHHFQCPASFHDNRTFFSRKEVAQIFISHIESPAPEAAPPVRLLD
jgi:hypothetical protein